MTDRSFETRIAANSIQLMTKVEGVMNPEGIVKRDLVLRAGRYHLHLDAGDFPFLSTLDPAMIVLSVIQVKVTKQPPQPMFATPQLILPKGGPASPLPQEPSE